MNPAKINNKTSLEMNDGKIELIPQIVVESAICVTQWMKKNDVKSLYGLTLSPSNEMIKRTKRMI